MRRDRIRWATPHLLWLLVVWVALWGEISAANVLSGLLVGGALVSLRPDRPERHGRVRPIALARLTAYFLWKLTEASVTLAWEVVTPRNHIREGVVAVQLRSSSDALVTVVANAITLTPGTLTLDVERNPTVLYLHVLHLQDEEEVRREIRHLEDLVIAAFGSDQQVAALRGGPSTELGSSQSTTALTGDEQEPEG